MTTLTHIDTEGKAAMVDVSAKPDSNRFAKACAEMAMLPSTLDLVVGGNAPKGDVLSVARVAGIQAAKRTSELIPLCHSLSVASIAIEFERASPNRLRVTGVCRATGKTGVEMEAMTGVSVAALTIYDMCKGIERGVRIENIRLTRKSGGKSGDWTSS